MPGALGLGHDELHGFVHPNGLFFAIPEPGEKRYRVVMEAEEPPVGTELTLADFQAALDERGPGNATLSDPGWITPFKVNARRAEKLSRGARVHCRRCRAYPQPDRRPGAEYRDAGFLQSGVEAGARHPRPGRSRGAGQLSDRADCRSRMPCFAWPAS